jgi:hypothetical protein
MIMTGIETEGLRTRIGGMILMGITAAAAMAMQEMIIKIIDPHTMILDVRVMGTTNAEDTMETVTTETWKITTGERPAAGTATLPA